VLESPSATNYFGQIFSAKINLNGDLLWWRRYDETNDSIESILNSYGEGAMVKNHRGNFVCHRLTYDNYTELWANNTEYLVEFNFQGDLVQRVVIDSTMNYYEFYSTYFDSSDSTYLMNGSFDDSTNLQTPNTIEGFLMKLDTLGNVLWQQEYDDTYGVEFVTRTDNEGYWLSAFDVIGGDCDLGGYNNTNMIVIRTSNEGEELNRITMDGICGDEKAKVVKLANNEFRLIGYQTYEEPQDFTTNPFQGYLFSQAISFEDNQIVLGTEVKEYGHTLYRKHFDDVIETTDGGYAIVGYSIAGDGVWPYLRGSIFKLDENLDSLWYRRYYYFDNGSEYNVEHYIYDAAATPDSGLVCVGSAAQGVLDPNPGMTTPWIFKTDSYGCIEPGCQFVNVSEIVIGLENTMSVYPNPVGSTASVAFSFPSGYSPPNASELIVIDTRGREVLRQSISLYGQQSETVELDLSGLATGLYQVHWMNGSAWLDTVQVVKE
jgi:hypothetical protein